MSEFTGFPNHVFESCNPTESIKIPIQYLKLLQNEIEPKLKKLNSKLIGKVSRPINRGTKEFNDWAWLYFTTHIREGYKESQITVNICPDNIYVGLNIKRKSDLKNLQIELQNIDKKYIDLILENFDKITWIFTSKNEEWGRKTPRMFDKKEIIDQLLHNNVYWINAAFSKNDKIVKTKRITNEILKIIKTLYNLYALSTGERIISNIISGEWTYNECYLAVWGYDQLDIDRSLNKNRLFSEISDIIGIRNENAVQYKIRNVSFFDKRPRAKKPISEMTHAQIELGEVFNWYWVDRIRARSFKHIIEEKFQFGRDFNDAIFMKQKQMLPEVLYEEGHKVRSSISLYKRSQKLVKDARAYYQNNDPKGILRCSVCGFYTPKFLSREVVEIHHLESLNSLAGNKKIISTNDLPNHVIPLCPTCHRISHTGKPPLKVRQIKKIFRLPQ